MTIPSAALSLLLLATTSAGMSVESALPSTALPEHTFTRSQRLDATARASTGGALPGVTVSLCRYVGPGAPVEGPSPSERKCRQAVTDANGRASFETISAGVYYLTGELDGFAGTAIYPLSIGGEDPIAPDQVVLTLNPVCWHC